MLGAPSNADDLQLHTGPEGPLIVHKDVHEGRKRGGQLTLGTPLKIRVSSGGSISKELTFEDLDEIMARHVDPIFEKFQEVVRHRYRSETGRGRDLGAKVPNYNWFNPQDYQQTVLLH